MVKEIVSISLGPASRDYELTARLFGQEFHVRRLGVDGDVGRAATLVAQSDGQVDAIGLGSMSLGFRVGARTYLHQQIQHVAAVARVTPVVDGSHLKSTLERWAVGQVAAQQRGIFAQKRVLVVSGVDRYAMAEVLSGYTPDIRFADPVVHLNAPFVLHSFKALGRYAAFVLPTLCRGSFDRIFPVGKDQETRLPRGSKHFERADVIAGDYAYIRRYAPMSLRRKIVITSAVSAVDVEELRQNGVELLVAMVPPLGEDHQPTSLDVLEAMFVSMTDRPPAQLSDDDFLNLIDRSELRPQVISLNKPPDVPRFAFVIHPLSVDNIFNHPILKYLRFLPHRLVEWSVGQIRPLYISRIRGVRSAATGQEVEGYLLSLGATPRELMRHKPGFTYRRLIVASRMAQRLGAQIMGLGAFTKVVGDAGMTVAYKSDIAITSGNSLSVAATLEAAKQAVLKMGGRVDQGKAVVVGATGSIGAVCSRLIAQAIQNVVLVAPRPEKLIPLKHAIEAETPGAKVTVALSGGAYMADADLVVTTTTAAGEKVIDILELKPGCVVCDVARPADVHEEDARLRPDVLVVESGEVLLPGEPDFGFNIGLPPGVAYACLAETALLAMEGRYENFTLGRNIEMGKVKEIYRLFKKHGLQIEGLRSFGRYVTDEEIATKRELADDLRQHPEKLESLRDEARRRMRPAAVAERGLRRIGPWAAGAAGALAVTGAWLLSRRRRQ